LALGMIGAQAMAEESNALTGAGDRSTHAPAGPLPMFAPGATQNDANPADRPLGLRPQLSSSEKALMAAPATATPVIVPAASLAASAPEQKLLSSGAPAMQNGFAPIKAAALATHGEARSDLSRSADKAMISNLYAPSN
jgi:hypothetical protein